MTAFREMFSSLMRCFPGTFPECPSSSPVFEMIYEWNPVRCKFERRLEVRTSPLNIIYNPQAIKKVTEFFYKGRVHTSGQPLNLFSLVPDDILSWGKKHITDPLGNQILILIIYMNNAMFRAADSCKGVYYSGFGYQSELELRVAEAARRQYNKLKMQTKAEIRQTIDQLLVGEFIVSKLSGCVGLAACWLNPFCMKLVPLCYRKTASVGP